MDPLKICSVEFDDRDPYRTTFNVHLSRDMTAFERQTLPPLLSGAVAAQVAARVEDVRERAAAIDWS